MRRFPDETVVLNLATGDYHGVDETGGAFLDALQANDDLGGAVEVLAAAYEVDRARLRADLEQFCDRLLERGLIEREDDEPG